jgi:hypothetical protein
MTGLQIEGKCDHLEGPMLPQPVSRSFERIALGAPKTALTRLRAARAILVQETLSPGRAQSRRGLVESYGACANSRRSATKPSSRSIA